MKTNEIKHFGLIKNIAAVACFPLFACSESNVSKPNQRSAMMMNQSVINENLLMTGLKLSSPEEYAKIPEYRPNIKNDRREKR